MSMRCHAQRELARRHRPVRVPTPAPGIHRSNPAVRQVQRRPPTAGSAPSAAPSLVRTTRAPDETTPPLIARLSARLTSRPHRAVRRAASQLTAAVSCAAGGHVGRSTAQTPWESSALSLAVTRLASARSSTQRPRPRRPCHGSTSNPGGPRQPGVGSRPTEAAWLRLDQTWPRRRLVQLDDEESRASCLSRL